MGLNLRDLYGIDLGDEVAAAAPPGMSGVNLTDWRMRSQGHGVAEGDLRLHRDFAIWFATRWLKRAIDAVDRFEPDMIYFDGGRGGYPFSGVSTGRGLRADATPRIIAHFLNSNARRHGGQQEGLAFAKADEDPRAVGATYESRFPEGVVRDRPWQAETSLGEWFYKNNTFYDSSMVAVPVLSTSACLSFYSGVLFFNCLL